MSLGTLTVIVPMYNCCENVIKTLRKLKDQSANYAKRLEVIVVDDGSTDNSAQFCMKKVYHSAHCITPGCLL